MRGHYNRKVSARSQGRRTVWSNDATQRRLAAIWQPTSSATAGSWANDEAAHSPSSRRIAANCRTDQSPHIGTHRQAHRRWHSDRVRERRRRGRCAVDIQHGDARTQCRVRRIGASSSASASTRRHHRRRRRYLWRRRQHRRPRGGARRGRAGSRYRAGPRQSAAGSTRLRGPWRAAAEEH